jgi:hypothetical protein
MIQKLSRLSISEMFAGNPFADDETGKGST